MKTLSIVTAFIILVAIAHTAFASPIVDTPPTKPSVPSKPKSEGLGNYTIMFYNSIDRPPAPPFLAIKFIAISEQKRNEVSVWREEIDLRIQKAGGVFTREDYEMKISPILVDYIKRFVGTGAETIIMDFPRIKQGVFLQQKK